MNLGLRINQTRSPESRLADQVCSYYAQRPGLIERLLWHFGAQSIRMMGNEIRSTCPIHRGSNPEAFAIWIDKGTAIWKCHTDCQATKRGSGTIITLVMKKYPQAGFPGAVAWAGQFAGLTIDVSGIQVSKETLYEETHENWRRMLGLSSAREDVMNIFNEDMVYNSMHWLYNDPNAALARDWLTGPAHEKTPAGERKKQFPWHILQHFQVGFTRARTWLYFDHAEDRFKGWWEDRIAIPWRNMQGQCCGFGGRRLDGFPERKYKNLPGTSRALALYGLSDPRCLDMIRRTRQIHFFEGYNDVWRAHQFGCFNATAVGGTDFTRQQLELIASTGAHYGILGFDGDLAGQTASNKYAKQLQRVVEVYTATYPQGVDPGDCMDESSFWQPLVSCERFIPRS